MSRWNLSFKNIYAKLPEDFYTKMPGEGFAQDPWVIHANPKGAELIGLSNKELQDKDFALYFSGNKPLPGSEPLAMVYSGHQFGQWAGQLGDGRALLLGQIKNFQGELWDIQLKGSGKTPYSRFGDGRAVLRSCIREYLCSEAIHSLNIPTTRSLCIIGTGEPVAREAIEPGAIFTRLAKSHIRFGHFEHFYYRQQFDYVKLLADHVIDNYFPNIAQEANRYNLWFSEVVELTAKLISKWQSIGFSHGVMNTDNMSILGLTIDYGPFGFMESFNPSYICNHSDTSGRYSFENQPTIGLWNLHALANALKPIIPIEESSEILKSYETVFTKTYQTLMYVKLGLSEYKEGDTDLLFDLLKLMAANQSDYTLTLRYLAYSFKDQNKWLDLFDDKQLALAWLTKYHKRVNEAGTTEEKITNKLNAINPKFILRNWVAEIAIRQAEDKKDYTMIDNLLNILHLPYDEHTEFNYLASPAPEQYQNICVSCSS